MKKIVLTASLAFSGFVSFTQPASAEKSDSIIFFYCDEILAEYPGGQTAIIKLFTDSMRYPIKAERQGIGGKVIVQYMVDTFGNTTGIKILQGVRNDLNNEAIRLIKLLRGWTPASLHNKKFNAYWRQPFIFIPAKRKRKL
jgi:TonB family protein